MLSSKVFRIVSVGLFLALSSVTPVFAGSWEDAIEDVEAKADRYWDLEEVAELSLGSAQPTMN
ncbi:hypothetical protein AN191_02990 [Loktanella sp. 5RATIMAR09]|nr:hypothetical protein AN191_02990 [Loktanella sp. 5RATIMAR09]